MKCRFAPIQRTAAQTVARLHRACFPEDPWSVGAIEQIMSIPGFLGRIAWVGEIAAGFALALNLGKEFEIVSLGVAPDHQRAGIGAALLFSVCCEAVARAADGVVLEVAVNNAVAQRLYTGHGFIVVGRRRNYYRQAGGLVDALILRLTLATALLPT